MFLCYVPNENTAPRDCCGGRVNQIKIRPPGECYGGGDVESDLKSWSLSSKMFLCNVLNVNTAPETVVVAVYTK
jgi:hypothetical protein